MTKARATTFGLLGLAVSAVLVVAIGVGNWSARRIQRAAAPVDNNLQRLFNEASADPSHFVSSGRSIAAIQQIGTDKSDRATGLLIALSTNGSQIPGFNIQPTAIGELKGRSDPRIPGTLARLINTNTLLDTRKAASTVLTSFPCDVQCVQALLSYLNDIYQGQLNIEDRGVTDFGPTLEKPVKERLASEQSSIYAEVYSELMKTPTVTNTVLTDQFGLGSESPKEFAINFAVKANDSGACAALTTSLQNLSASSGQAIRPILLQAVYRLRCTT